MSETPKNPNLTTSLYSPKADIFKPCIGTVTADGTRDLTSTGKLLVTIRGRRGDNEPVVAHSIMPFGGRSHGLFGPIEPLSNVMLLPISAQPYDVNSIDVKWFWVGVIPGIDFVPIEPPEMNAGNSNQSKIVVRSTLPEAERVYALDKTPTKTVMKNLVGHKLELAETIFETSNGELVQDDYAMLTTNTDKYIKLDAGVGPTMDRIIITDEKDNRIVIKTGDDGDTDPGWGPESITIECTGNMHLLSKTGEMDIRVHPESSSDITVHNEGKGDITVRCEQSNIFVFAEKDVVVQSENVRVKTTKSVYVDAGENVEVTSKGDASVIAEGNVDVTSNKAVSVVAKDTLSLTSTSAPVTITSPSLIALSAPLITLD